MHRLTGWVMGRSPMRQDQSLPREPYHTRSASPFRSSKARHLRIEGVSFMAIPLIDSRLESPAAFPVTKKPSRGSFATTVCRGLVITGR